MEVHEHKHPLCQVDLQPNYPRYEEEYDDESGELVTEEELQGRCNWCKKDIMFFHRYYYKCPDPSCNYLLHKFCKELPRTLKHASHTKHTLKLFQWENYEGSCGVCGSDPKSDALSYHCSKCHFDIHVNCGMAVTWAEDRIIYHPSHQHPLVATPKPISCECNACGNKHEGIFYLCTTCAGFFIHTDCVRMPKTLVIKLNGVSSHTHPLTLSYSFPRAYQKARFDPPCRMCNKSFHDENLWIYKCEKCRYYVHFACSKMASVSDDENRHLLKEFPYPYDTIVHLPFIDETLNVLKNLFFKQNGNQTFEDNFKNKCHKHPLYLVHEDNNTGPTSSRSDMLLSCHDPMKKIELLCNGCLRQITSKPFYKCVRECNFVLHEWCTQLPATVQHHLGHQQHTLTLYRSPPNKFFPVFVCAVCKLPCNGFVYSCVECDYHIDVNCAFIPEMIKHEAHPHVLMLVDFSLHDDFHFESCRLCLNETTGYRMSFYCFFCHAFLHVKCAFLLPGKIKHKYDKHPMNLSYLPIENHKGDYFCEICEDELNPQHCFYHCSQPHCNQSIHSSCAPFILESETATSTRHDVGVYEYVNIKFGGIHNIKDHPHNLKFVLGTGKDGRCTECDCKLQYNLIFKCLQCKFAIDFKCCERLSYGFLALLMQPKGSVSSCVSLF